MTPEYNGGKPVELEEIINVIKFSFFHLHVEEDVQIGSRTALIYFPTMGIAVFEKEVEGSEFGDRIVQRDLDAKSVYIEREEVGFNVGHVINDIILQAEMIPSK